MPNPEGFTSHVEQGSTAIEMTPEMKNRETLSTEVKIKVAQIQTALDQINKEIARRSQLTRTDLSTDRLDSDEAVATTLTIERLLNERLSKEIQEALSPEKNKFEVETQMGDILTKLDIFLRSELEGIIETVDSEEGELKDPALKGRADRARIERNYAEAQQSWLSKIIGKTATAKDIKPK